MNNIEKQKALRNFKNAIRGWSFCDNKMLANRIEAGQIELAKLPNELKGEAMEILLAMSNALIERHK